MPSLTCDRPEERDMVEYYTIVGLPDNPTSPLSDDPKYGLKYDISELPADTYNIMVSACNYKGCSLTTPLEFTVPEKPSPPTGLGILFP